MSFDAGTLMVALEQGNPIPDILPAMSRHQGGESELAPSRGGLEPGNKFCDSGKGAPAAPYDAASRDKVGGEEQGEHTPLPLASA